MFGDAQRQLVGLPIGFKEKGNDVSFLVYHNEGFFKYLLDVAKIPVVSVIEPNYFTKKYWAIVMVRDMGIDRAIWKTKRAIKKMEDF